MSDYEEKLAKLEAREAAVAAREDAIRRWEDLQDPEKRKLMEYSAARELYNNLIKVYGKYMDALQLDKMEVPFGSYSPFIPQDWVNPSEKYNIISVHDTRGVILYRLIQRRDIPVREGETIIGRKPE